MTSHFIGKVSVRAIIEKDGKVLLVSDARDGVKDWETPGGRIDVGEGIVAALHREMREELGVDVIIGGVVHSGQFLHPDEHATQLTITFHCTLADPSAPIMFQQEEVAEARWIDANDIDAITFFGDCKDALIAFYGRTE